MNGQLIQECWVLNIILSETLRPNIFLATAQIVDNFQCYSEKSRADSSFIWFAQLLGMTKLSILSLTASAKLTQFVKPG